MKQAFAFALVATALLATSPVAQGVTPPKISNIETPGNLAPTTDIGCAKAGALRNTLTAADLYRGLAACAKSKDYKAAAFLFAMAGAYARFDTLRVADRTAHQAATVLRMQYFDPLPKRAKQNLATEIEATLGQPAGLAATCATLRSLGVPDYYPAYMIQHGMGAVMGRDGGLVAGFDATKAWQQALDGYLHCPAAAPPAAAPAGDPLYGIGFGLDHLVVVVRDLAAAQAVFRDQLGFKLPPKGPGGHHPSGTMNASAYFANVSYIELLAVEDRDKVARSNPATLAFVDKHEGALYFALSTSDAAQTAARLKALRFPADGPATGTITRPGDTAPPKPKWLSVDFTEPAPAPLFFIQYLDMDYVDIFKNWDEGYAEAKTAPYYQQPNTATGFSAVWIAVRDIDEASATYAKLLTGGHRDFHSATLGARVRAFKLVRQQVFLLQADSASSPVAQFIAERGPGIMGASVEVKDLAAAAGVMKALPDPGPMKTAGLVSADSLVVPASLAHGLWLEFHAAEVPAKSLH